MTDNTLGTWILSLGLVVGLGILVTVASLQAEKDDPLTLSGEEMLAHSENEPTPDNPMTITGGTLSGTITDDPRVVGIAIDVAGKISALCARDWQTGTWTTIATDSQGRMIPSPERLPVWFKPPDQPNPLYMAIAAEDPDENATVILTDSLGRVVVVPK